MMWLLCNVSNQSPVLVVNSLLSSDKYQIIQSKYHLALLQKLSKHFVVFLLLAHELPIMLISSFVGEVVFYEFSINKLFKQNLLMQGVQM